VPCIRDGLAIGRETPCVIIRADLTMHEVTWWERVWIQAIGSRLARSIIGIAGPSLNDPTLSPRDASSLLRTVRGRLSATAVLPHGT
jgi:hypothetical protein